MGRAFDMGCTPYDEPEAAFSDKNPQHDDFRAVEVKERGGDVGQKALTAWPW